MSNKEREKYLKRAENYTNVDFTVDKDDYNRLKQKLSYTDKSIAAFLTDKIVRFINDESIKAAEEKKTRIIDIEKEKGIVFNKKCKELEISKTDLFIFWIKEFVNE